MPLKRTEAKPKATKKTARKRAATPVAAQEEVAVRAYFLHLAGGGDPLENWLRAEQELRAA
jgi:Protein of unknown function (DUF2934)